MFSSLNIPKMLNFLTNISNFMNMVINYPFRHTLQIQEKLIIF